MASFFATERNAPGTLSVAEAVNTVNIAYNAQLEQLQADDYDDIVIQGQAADWPEVLAVFATRYAGADDGVDVATLDRTGWKTDRRILGHDGDIVMGWKLLTIRAARTARGGRSTSCTSPFPPKPLMRCGQLFLYRVSKLRPG